MEKELGQSHFVSMLSQDCKTEVTKKEHGQSHFDTAGSQDSKAEAMHH